MSTPSESSRLLERMARLRDDVADLAGAVRALELRLADDPGTALLGRASFEGDLEVLYDERYTHWVVRWERGDRPGYYREGTGATIAEAIYAAIEDDAEPEGRDEADR